MAVEGAQPLKITLEAATDLSSKQYYFIKKDANGRATPVTAATDVIVGVLQNKPKGLGQTAEVVVSGKTKMVSAGVIAIQANIGPDATGKAQSVTPTGLGGAYVQGTKLSAGYLDQTSAAAAGDVISAVVNCTNVVPAT